MATSFAWVSVVVKCGQDVLCPRSVVKCSWDDKFGSLLTQVGGIGMEERIMTKIIISRTEKFTDPTHIVPPDAPIILCEQFNCFHVCLYVSEVSVETDITPSDHRNVFDVLMAATCERVLPKSVEPSEGKGLRSDQQLYNDILSLLETMKVGWRRDNVESTGVAFVRKLSRVLWYLDAHHEKFSGRGIIIPDHFSQFQRYNDFKRKKEKEPRLSVSGLDEHIKCLSELLMQPWFTCRVFDVLRQDVEKLVESMSKYKLYLTSKCAQIKQHHQSLMAPPVGERDNASLLTLPGTGEPASLAYSELQQRLEGLPLYQPLFVNDIAPTDRYERRKWVSGFKFSFPIMLYKFAYGNNLGTLLYVWRIPINQPIDSMAVSQVYSQLSSQQKFYSTSAMRREYLNQYSHVAKIPKMLLRNIYRTLLNDESAPYCAVQGKIDERVALAVISVDDPDIILANGNPSSTIFDTFWQELQAYLDELLLAVDDRRHGEALHMPLAISVRHLREKIIERLHSAYETVMPAVPSEEWIRLQFWPPNPYTSQALRYSGRFQVKFGVQIRQLRKDHPDQHYVSALLQYVRHFSVLIRDVATYMSVDDKAIVPVGEPKAPVSTGVRGHNRSLIPAVGPQLEALDHDFHLHGIVPSVAFCVDTPESATDCFYNGQPVVTNKVTQPSSALRHASEMNDLIRTHFCNEGGIPKPVLIIVSDGGPDHRVTFGSVKIASVALFMALDLDMLVCVRTCPYQSWQNIAERVMSTLNLALQNVSLQRSAMIPEYERAVKNKNTLSDLRKMINSDSDLRGAIEDSMAAPTTLIGQRFQSMKIKENYIKLGVPASERDIDEMFQHVLLIDPSIPRDNHTAKGLENCKSLHKFLDSHSHSSI